jgi:hypothetical protein
METAFQEVKEGEPFPGSVLRLINRAIFLDLLIWAAFAHRHSPRGAGASWLRKPRSILTPVMGSRNAWLSAKTRCCSNLWRKPGQPEPFCFRTVGRETVIASEGVDRD